ncbi:MAG: hypothetical protein NW224_16615 [Leptolyngbyaceae cyanobacterium bins.302]|nr:hypothetical protein [Leptolyngbyaceae cyanobacterium bins.302]
MQTVKRSSLFTDLSSQESATVRGAWGRHYYSPVYYCYPVSSGGSWGGSSGSSVSQSVNVNVYIDD